MQKKYNFLFLTVILSLSISLSFPLWGLTADKPFITIHNLINLTGIYAPISIPCEKGGKDFLTWVSDQGGLDINLDGKGDVEIKYLWAEIGDSEAQWMSAYKRFRMGRARFSLIEMITTPKPRPILLETWHSPKQKTVKTILERDGVVSLGFGLNEGNIYPPTWHFSNLGSPLESAVGAIEYYIDHLWPKKGKGSKAKVAYLNWNLVGGQTVNQLLKKHSEKTGKFEILVERSFNTIPSEKEIGELLSDFDKREVDVIWSNSTIQTSAAIIKAIHKLDLRGKMVLLGNQYVPPDGLLEMIGPTSAEGYISPQSIFIPAAEPDEAGVKFARMLNDKYRKELRLPNIHYMHGIRMKANMLESVRRTLVGMMKRDNIDLAKACKWITGKDIKELGIQTLVGYSAYDTTTKLQSAPASKEDRRLTDHARLIGIKEGKVAVLSHWYKVPRLVPEDLTK